MSARVSVVAVTRNNLKNARVCIPSVLRHIAKDSYEIIVVDNGSTDGTAEYIGGLSQAYSRVKLVLNPVDIGFVRAINLGLTICDPRSDVVTIDDVVIGRDDWITILREAAYSDEKVGIVGCRLLDETKRQVHAGTFILVDNMRIEQSGARERDIGQHGSLRQVEAVTLACAYLRRSVLDNVGFLSEDYVSSFAHIDYCLKARKAGFEVLCTGRLTATHLRDASTLDVNETVHGDLAKFVSRWGEFVRHRYKTSVLWHSSANLRVGYAIASTYLMEALDDVGVQLRYKYVYGPGTPVPDLEFPAGNPRIEMFRARKDQPALEVIFAQGDVFYKNLGTYKVGYTMLEVDGIPKEWVWQANRMDEVWVPSRFNQTTFKNSGVQVPIYVMPLGVDTNYFNPEIRAKRLSDRFTFLSVFEWSERKGAAILAKAYVEEFSEHENVLLVFDIMDRTGSENARQEILSWKLRSGSPPIIVSVNRTIPRYQMGCLYRSADCFVLPTRGEGFGLPIIEAMACELPVIATEWGGHTDFFGPKTGFPVHFERLIPAVSKNPYYAGLNWAEPSVSHLRTQMRYVYEHAEEAREIAHRGRLLVSTHFTWRTAAEKIRARLLAIEEASPVMKQ